MANPLIVRQRPHLELALKRFNQGDAPTRQAVDALREEANQAPTAGPFTVTDKQVTPPSGDKRDYMSQGPYWWPNPDTADGLPYVRRDGEKNPESEDSDRPKLNGLVEAVDTLALAWHFTGEDHYAQRAGELLQIFFLDKNRGMRPHLNFGQAIPGICQGRGIGIIETWIFAEPLVDAMRLLEDSPGLPESQAKALRQWFGDFLDWLQSSPHGQDEAKEHNNHGTAWDLQVCALALYTGQEELAREKLETVAERRLAAHIEPDGSQPHELARTRALSYSTFNLRMLTSLAEMGQRLGVDLWRFDRGGRSLGQAIDFLLPYWTQSAPFPYEQIVPFEPAPARLTLRRAAWALGRPDYAATANKLPKTDDSSQRCRLLYPTPMP